MPVTGIMLVGIEIPGVNIDVYEELVKRLRENEWRKTLEATDLLRTEDMGRICFQRHP